VVTDTIRIIVVEDDDGHATLVERNLRRAGLANPITPITRFTDGQEALDYFFGPDAGVDGYCDCVLLLDINLPRVDGVEVLRRLKSERRTATIPTIMLTTTDDPREVERCYQLGCNVYITKPVDYDTFIDAIRRLGFFLQIVKIPTRG
jgi:CheY-like chemotaxis protein